MATTPVFSLLVGCVLARGERLPVTTWAGITLGITGVAVLLGGEAAAGAGGAPWGILACLAAALSYALANAYGRRFQRMGMDPAVGAFGQIAATALMALPLVLLLDQPWRLAAPGVGVWGALLGLAQTAPKPALAYSTMSQMGLLVAVFAAGLNQQNSPLGIRRQAVCQEAARPWGHRHNRSTQPSRRLLPLEQRQRLARRELQEHVHILDQLALLESPRARERVPPQAQKELDLRCRLVLNPLELDAADRLGPILELHHAARSTSGRRSRGAQVVDVHRHGDGQGTRSARHIEDDVDKEYLKRPRHAARAEIAIEMTEQMLPRSLILMKPVEQEGSDPRGKWQHRESCLHI
jgi:hypothetical protein